MVFSEWYDENSRVVSYDDAVFKSRHKTATPNDPMTLNDDGLLATITEQRDSGVSSAKETSEHLDRFLNDVATSAAESTVNLEKNYTRAMVQIDGYKNGHQGRRVAECADRFAALTKKMQNLQLPLRPVSHRAHASGSSHREVEKGRGVLHGRYSPDEIVSDIPILADFQHKPSELDDDVFLPNPTILEKQKKPKRSKVKLSEPIHYEQPPSRNDSGQHSGGSSCHSAKNCCHHTTIYQYPVQPERHHYDDELPEPRRQSRRQSRRHLSPDPLKSIASRSEAIRAGLRDIKRSVTVFSKLSTEAARELRAYEQTRYGSLDIWPFSNSKPIPVALTHSSSTTVVPSKVTAADVVFLMKMTSRYFPLASLVETTLARRNIRNYVLAVQNILERHADMLGRQIVRFQNVPLADTVPLKRKIIADRQAQRDLCLAKAKDLEEFAHSDATGLRRLPLSDHGPRPSADNLNYQHRLIYGCFLF